MNIRRVDHMGVIVADMDGAVRGFSEHLGLPIGHTERYRDELDIVFLPCGDTSVELICPIVDEGFSAQHLARHGPSIQHVAFEVQDIRGALEELSSRGVGAVGEAPRPGAAGALIAFLDPDAFGGVIVELCELPA